LDAKILNHLQINNIEIKKYQDIYENLNKNYKDKKFIIDPKHTSMAVYSSINKNNNEIVKQSPSAVSVMKCTKTPHELKGMQEAQKYEAVALSCFFSYLEECALEGNSLSKINEYEASQILESYRRQLKPFLYNSFETISSIGENGAVIHYSPSATKSSALYADTIYLCDSGGQFLAPNGTTDATRSIFLQR